MARKKTTKTTANVAEKVEESTVSTEHNHAELEAKVAALEERVASLSEQCAQCQADVTPADKIVELAIDAVGDLVEAKVKSAIANIKSGKVDIDFEEVFQWFAARRKRGRPFRK